MTGCFSEQAAFRRVRVQCRTRNFTPPRKDPIGFAPPGKEPERNKEHDSRKGTCATERPGLARKGNWETVEVKRSQASDRKFFVCNRWPKFLTPSNPLFCIYRITIEITVAALPSQPSIFYQPCRHFAISQQACRVRLISLLSAVNLISLAPRLDGLRSISTA